MGKLFGVVLAIIAIVSAYPIVAHWYVQPVDISTHGHAIDEQLADTMAEAGLSFLGAQLLLAFFVWRFSQRKPGSRVWNIPGGATLMVAAAFILVGTEILALGVLGQKAWANVYFTPTQIGKYEIVCTQLCGLGHYNMKAYLNVLSQEDFDKWMKQKISEQ